jgi:hypothetical protein
MKTHSKSTTSSRMKQGMILLPSLRVGVGSRSSGWGYEGSRSLVCLLARSQRRTSGAALARFLWHATSRCLRWIQRTLRRRPDPGSGHGSDGVAVPGSVHASSPLGVRLFSVETTLRQHVMRVPLDSQQAHIVNFPALVMEAVG